MSGNAGNNTSKKIVPAKFAHAVLRTNKFKQMVDWYKTVLQANIVFENQMLAFMTYDDEHHRLAIAAFPGIEDRAPRASTISPTPTQASVIWSRRTKDSRPRASRRRCPSITA